MRLWKLFALSLALGPLALAQTTITIATVNNPDMITMQKLTPEFEKANPGIKVNWVVLPENELRQKVTTDIATNAGSYDILTIGTYEAPIWGKNGWLVEISGLPASYDLEDIIKPVRAGLSYQGKLYALPFYAESSMLYYRKDLFAARNLTVPAQPTWTQAINWARTLHNPSAGVYGICLRGLPGWGENMAFLSTLVNTYGGRWFDENWRPQLTSPEWKRAIGQYVELVTKYGPPGVTGNGFTENLTLMAEGKCAMWIDATVAAGYLANPKTSKVADKIGFAKAPVATTPNGSHWLWSWALAIPKSSKKVEAAKTFITWATSKDYIALVGRTQAGSRPRRAPATRPTPTPSTRKPPPSPKPYWTPSTPPIPPSPPSSRCLTREFSSWAYLSSRPSVPRWASSSPVSWPGAPAWTPGWPRPRPRWRRS